MKSRCVSRLVVALGLGVHVGSAAPVALWIGDPLPSRPGPIGCVAFCGVDPWLLDQADAGPGEQSDTDDEAAPDGAALTPFPAARGLPSEAGLGTYALMLAGLVAIGAVKRRRVR